jgi:hypothetical protein
MPKRNAHASLLVNRLQHAPDLFLLNPLEHHQVFCNQHLTEKFFFTCSAHNILLPWCLASRRQRKAQRLSAIGLKRMVKQNYQQIRQKTSLAS